MPAQVTNYQCPGCTGPLHFVGASGKLECEYCGASYDVAEIEALYAEKEERAAAAQQAAEEKASKKKEASADGGDWDTSGFSDDWGEEGAHMKAYSCPSCGAELICDESTAATSCPYCGNPTVVPGQFSGQLKPDFIIPFKLSREDAIKALREHYKGKILLPKTFTNENHVQEIRGVYVPFWMFDGKAMGDARYEATRSHSYTSGDYEITKTEHFDIYRAGSVTFEKVPVDASSKMPDDHMDSIEPYDYKGLKSFSTAYLPGFLADKYDVSVEESRERADQRCEGTLEAALRGSVKGYDTCTHLTGSTDLGQGTLRPHARVDAQYQVAGKGLPLCHERADRKAGRRPAGQLGKILGHVCRHCGAPFNRRLHRSHAADAVTRGDGHEKKNDSFADHAFAGAGFVRPRHGSGGVRCDLR